MDKYKLSKYEQETVINLNADEDTATLYTAQPKWIRKMDSLAEKHPELFSCIRKDEVSKVYEFPKKLICIRSKEKTMSLTEQQKKAATKRLG